MCSSDLAFDLSQPVIGDHEGSLLSLRKMLEPAALAKLPPSTTAPTTLTPDKIRPSKGMTSTPDFQSGKI